MLRLSVLRYALKASLAYRLRGFFCLFSVALGVASITIIVAAVEGAYKRAFDIIERFGHDSVLILGGSQQTRAVGIRERTLTFEDITSINNHFPTAYLVVPMTSKGNVSVSYASRRHQTRVIGSTNQYSLAWTWPISMGTDFQEEDVKGYRNVSLIGQFIKERLFNNKDPVGNYIIVNNMPVKVIGVLSERGTSPGGGNLDDRIIMPITTVMKKLLNEHKYISAIRIRFSDLNNINYYIEELRNILRKNHNVRGQESDDFFIVTPKEIVRFLVSLTGSLVAFLGVVGTISLVVSGFVIANLFLISVKERSQEIGIRRAVGARRLDIMVQFLSEVFIITTCGALSGFMIGLLSASLLRRVADFPIHFSYKAFLASMAIAWVVAFLSGLHPARTASRMHPIEAIRG